MSHRRNELFKKPSAGGGGWYDGGNCLTFRADGRFAWGFSTATTHTFSFWFKSYVAIPNTIMGKSSVTNRYLQINTATNLRFRLGGDTTNFVIPEIVIGEWHHYFLARDVTTAKLWIDGVESSSGEQTYVGGTDSWNQAGGLGTQTTLEGEIDDIWLQKDFVGVEQDAIDIYNGGVGARPQPILGNGVANYRLNESWQDRIVVSDNDPASGSFNLIGFREPNPLILNNFVDGQWVTGKLGNALSFDGLGSFVDIPSTAVASTTWTLSYWFKSPDLSGIDTGIAFGHDGSGINYVGYHSSSTNISVRLTGTNNFTVPTLSNDTWYHVLISNNASSMKLYLNGVESSSGTLTAATVAFRLDLIGKRDGTLPFIGDLDDVLFKDGYVGTITDAVNIYNSGTGAAAIGVITTPTFNYKFDESGGTLIADDSGANNYDGNLTGFTSSDQWVTGVLGNALLFDAVDDNLTFEKSPDGSAKRSVSLWIKSSDIETDSIKLIGNSFGGNHYFRVDNTNNRFIIRAAAGAQVFPTIPALTNNTWYHIVIVENGTSVNAYLNGVESTSGTLTIVQDSSAYNFDEMNLDGGGQGTTATTRDLIGYWQGYALTQADVTELYNGGTGIQPETLVNGLDHQWGMWNMNGSGTDLEAEDLSELKVWVLHE